MNRYDPDATSAEVTTKAAQKPKLTAGTDIRVRPNFNEDNTDDADGSVSAIDTTLTEVEDLKDVTFATDELDDFKSEEMARGNVDAT